MLLAITVIGIGGLTAGIGAVIESNAASADATSVVDGFEEALQPTATTGDRTGELRFSEGHIHTEPRRIRVLNESGVIETVAADALVYESSDERVAYHGDAIVRGTPGNAWFRSDPAITIDRNDGGPLIVNAPTLNTTRIGVSGGSARPVRLATTVTHDRQALGDDEYRIAVETSTPGPWERFFEDVGASVEATDRTFPGDEEPSVVARIDGERTGYLVTHDMRLEVGYD